LRASVDANGAGGNGYSHAGTISSDGHYVAFESLATNLWPTTDQNGTKQDIFEFDVYANSLMGLLSVGQQEAGEVWANGASIDPAMSGDGLYVAFSSRATNLSATDTNLADDVFTHTWVDPSTRTRCKTQRQTRPLPVPLWFSPPAPNKPNFDRRCQDDLPKISRTDPAPSRTSPVQWYDVFDTFQAVPLGGGASVPVFLRYGNTPILNPAAGWLGWGYRKIYVKHGWSVFIKGNVALALASTPVVQGTTGVYFANYPYKGNNCRIKVVVQFAQNMIERAIGYPAKHIITVHAWKV